MRIRHITLCSASSLLSTLSNQNFSQIGIFQLLQNSTGISPTKRKKQRMRFCLGPFSSAPANSAQKCSTPAETAPTCLMHQMFCNKPSTPNAMHQIVCTNQSKAWIIYTKLNISTPAPEKIDQLFWHTLVPKSKQIAVFIHRNHVCRI